MVVFDPTNSQTDMSHLTGQFPSRAPFTRAQVLCSPLRTVIAGRRRFAAPPLYWILAHQLTHSHIASLINPFQPHVIFLSHPRMPTRSTPSSSLQDDDLTLPGVAAAHVEQPNQTVELDIQALDLPPTLAFGRSNEGQASAGLVGRAKSGMPAQADGLTVNGVDAVDLDRERGV